MADVPAAFKEGSSAKSTDEKALLFMTQNDGASGLEAVLFTAVESQVVYAQELGILAVGLPIADSATALAAKAVGSSTTEVLAARTGRVCATFVNDSDETIYLALGVNAVMNRGIRLNANGGAYEINWTNMFRGAVDAICTSGGKNLCVMETYRDLSAVS